MNFAEWLREELHKRGMRQVELAREFNVYASTISFWISGKNQPDEEQIDKLAAYFEVDKSFLLRLMGKLDDGFAYTPEVAAMMQYIDQRLEEIDDPDLKEVVLERLKRDIAALTDTVERLAGLFDKKK